MICSMCKKNPAAIFSSKMDANGKREMEGLCIPCAKKLGINTDEILRAQNNAMFNTSPSELNKNLENLFKNLSEGLGEIDGIEFNAIPVDENLDKDENIEDGEPKVFAGAIPLGSIFGNIFNQKSQNSNDEVSSGNTKKKVKPEKKKQKNKKKKYLDTFGTNLTLKAQNNEIDMVIGRDKELQRVVQILNRRNPLYYRCWWQWRR